MFDELNKLMDGCFEDLFLGRSTVNQGVASQNMINKVTFSVV